MPYQASLLKIYQHQYETKPKIVSDDKAGSLEQPAWLIFS